MSVITLGNVKSPNGKLAFYNADPRIGPKAPVILFIHGGLRYSKELFHWGEQFEGIADVILLDIPGHGRSDPVSPATLANVVETIAEGIKVALAGRDVVIVGESLGGLISLMIGGRDDCQMVRAVIAADPPITTKKLLHVHYAFIQSITEMSDPSFMKPFAFDALGIAPDVIGEKIYYKVFENLRVPSTVISGDRELFPLRQNNAISILFDSVDQFVVENFYKEKVEVKRIKNGGHLILVENVEECREHILNVLHPFLPENSAGASR